MKKIYLFPLFFLLVYVAQAQAPQKLSYQAVLRNNSNQLLQNRPVGLRISLIKDSVAGLVVYSETHQSTTTNNGLINIQIGGGSPFLGTFNTIDWSKGNYYVKTETDPDGGTNYSIVGSSELLSVPYALYAANGGIPGPKGDKGDTGLLPNGNIEGNTPFWNGNEWVVNSNNIFNNGNSVGIGTGNPNTSAKVEINSTNQGFLPPRMTQVQRDAIVSPAVGLLIFNISSNCLNFFVGDGWNEVCGTKVISYDTITNLDCNRATINGTLTVGSVANNVSVNIEYEGGNGKNYNAQMIPSVGVKSLTAILAAGTLANGKGTLNYIITGTPTSSGTATFALNVGGKTCNLTLSIADNIAALYPKGTVFCANGPTKVVDVINPITGKIWMDRNLGASRVALSKADTAAFGDLFQWGRNSDGHQCRNSPNTHILSSMDQAESSSFIASATFDWRSPSNDSLWQGLAGINNPCPSGYRLPSERELEAELASWSYSTSDGAFNSPLKMPMSGYRDANGLLNNGEPVGNYWSSTVKLSAINNLTWIRNLGFQNDRALLNDISYRVYGFSVRCIKN